MVDSKQSTRRVFPPAGEDTEPACSHDAVQQLGVDAGQNRYLRCSDCEAVIVTFSATSQWEQQREALSTEPRDWNPLIDALRTKRSGPQEDPRHEDPRREDQRREDQRREDQRREDQRREDQRREDQRREDSHRASEAESLSDRVRQTWRRFLTGRR